MGHLITLGETSKTDDAFSAYVAVPPGQVKRGLIVIHEIWGLVDHIKQVADRYAAEGYLAVAPDLLSRVGIEAHLGEEMMGIMFNPDPEVRNAGQPKLREKLAPLQSPEYAEGAIASLKHVVDYLAAQPGIDGRIAVTGFCFGGSYSFALATADSRVKAAIPYYGQPPALDKVDSIACPILALYGENDPGLMETLPDVTAALGAAGVDFSQKVYEGAGHAFFNDTNPFSYKPDAAADAWSRSLAFLEQHLTVQSA